MENENINKISFVEKIYKLTKEKKRGLTIFSFITIIIVLLAIGNNYYKDKKNEEISEKYVQAGIYLSSKNLDKSKNIYEEIILSKNKFYSPLALNNIVENNLEPDSDKVLNLFTIVEEIKIKKKEKNLIKLKKALFLLKNSKTVEGNKLLKEIVADNSVWKDTALEILK
jgi:predicted negative regulator of RcsB-dependent stress response